MLVVIGYIIGYLLVGWIVAIVAGRFWIGKYDCVFWLLAIVFLYPFIGIVAIAGTILGGFYRNN